MWGPDGPPMHDTAWWSSWQSALMIGLMILIAGLLLWLVLRSRARPDGPATPARGEDEAVAQVRMRYARGELDRKAFAEMMQDLTGETPVEASEAAPGSAVPSSQEAPSSAAPPTEPA